MTTYSGEVYETVQRLEQLVSRLEEKFGIAPPGPSLELVPPPPPPPLEFTDDELLAALDAEVQREERWHRKGAPAQSSNIVCRLGGSALNASDRSRVVHALRRAAGEGRLVYIAPADRRRGAGEWARAGRDA